ncbi:hypothetical protein [Paenibacillus polymyxa]|uniref:hypothetical protein n=1 Tax=Paenibacillus TaxID=44249 RepID=UPI000737ADD6|nr:hypothetical protein [Paenibacillus polymyxa]
MIKQHWNIPTLFGATPNAVYGQLFCALIVYVLLKYYSMLLKRRGPTMPYSPARFPRLFYLHKLPGEWLILIQLVLLQNTSIFMD